MDAFLVAAGTVPGRDHTVAYRNCQDAFSTYASRECVISIVCDGCGSGTHSEVGAKLGARILAESLRERIEAGGERDPEHLLEIASDRLLAALHDVGAAMGGPIARLVHDHFLFTALGAVVLPEATFTFACGDGILACNGEPVVRSASGNAPSYAGYGLLGPPPRFEIVHRLATCRVDSLLLGSDGLAPLLVRPTAGRTLSDLWADDRLLGNPRILERSLRVWARERPRVDWDRHRIEREPGLFADDATAVVIRRRRAC
ncbi:MAG: protein phosphatase 2C domain-containing protein [Acidobacteriota bacterium]